MSEEYARDPDDPKAESKHWIEKMAESTKYALCVESKERAGYTETGMDGVTRDKTCPEYTASVKWDGCLNLWKNHSSPSGDNEPDYMHICSITKFIEYLTELRDLAIERFPDSYPEKTK